MFVKREKQTKKLIGRAQIFSENNLNNFRNLIFGKIPDGIKIKDIKKSTESAEFSRFSTAIWKRVNDLRKGLNKPNSALRRYMRKEEATKENIKGW